MSERVIPAPIDLTLQRLNRLEQKLDALFDHQKGLATHMAAMSRDINGRMDRLEQDVVEVRSTLREVRIEQVSHLNQILTAIQT